MCSDSSGPFVQRCFSAVLFCFTLPHQIWNEITSVRENRGKRQRKEHPLNIYECSLLHIPFSRVRKKVLQELLVPWQITARPDCWVLEDSGINVRGGTWNVYLISKFDIILRQRAEEQRKNTDVRLSGWNYVSTTTRHPPLTSEPLLKSIDGRKCYVYVFNLSSCRNWVLTPRVKTAVQ